MWQQQDMAVRRVQPREAAGGTVGKAQRRLVRVRKDGKQEAGRCQ